MAPLRVIRVIRIDGPLGPRGSRVRQPPGPRVVVAAGAADYKKGARLAPRVV